MAELKVTELSQHPVTREIIVSLQILDGEDIIERRYGFPSTLTPEEIKTELEKILSVYHSDKELFLRNKAQDEKDREFSLLKDDLEGTTIS